MHWEWGLDGCVLQKTVIRFYIITFDYYLSLCYYLLPNMESKRVCGKGDAQRCSTKKVFLKLFVKFTGKHRQRSLFLMKLHACNLTKKRLRNRCFPVHFEKKIKTSFSHNTSGQIFLRTDLDIQGNGRK